MDTEDAIRLLEMASIANSGGYFLRLNEHDEITGEDLDTVSLVIVIFLPGGKVRDDLPNSQVLPAFANAIAFAASTGPQPRLIRFEGHKHVNIEPTAPPGCVQIGLVRRMGWAAPDPSKPEVYVDKAKGFAESIHLTDIEISDKQA